MASIVRPLFLLLAVSTAPWVASPVWATPCGGFTDVDDSNPGQAAFCANAQWLKNRAITLGCTTSSLFCPTEDVIRLAMSAFLNRLGNALTPVNQTANTSGNALDIDVSPQQCATSAFPATFPRVAHGVAVFGSGCGTTCPSLTLGPGDAGQDVGDLDVAIGIVESTNNGATWAPVTPLSAVSTGPNQMKAATVLLPPRDLVPGTSYRWAIGVSRVPGSTGSIDVGSWQCQLQVRIENRVTSGAPFDVE
jgi:hypothetical protein